MLCPKCNSKTRTIDTRNNDKDNETYRRCSCNNKECGFKFYSVEFMAEETFDFKESWQKATKQKTKGEA